MDRLLAVCKWAVNAAAELFVGTRRRALLTIVVVVVVAVVVIANSPGFSAGVIFGLITALILD